jgi:hypothetical protein
LNEHVRVHATHPLAEVAGRRTEAVKDALYATNRLRRSIHSAQDDREFRCHHRPAASKPFAKIVIAASIPPESTFETGGRGRTSEELSAGGK